MEFKIGDHVYVAEWSTEYSGKYRRCYGVVKYITNKGKLGVELDGLRNNHSGTGLFLIDRKNLVLEKKKDEPDDEKTVLVGDLKNGYSYVTTKEAEELRVKKEVSERMYRNLESMISNSIYGLTSPQLYRAVEITKVIFNNPATIVFWSDGKKTVVKCAGDEAFDEEKGLAMAISKRVLGNQGNYYNEFKKWLPEIDICEDKGTSNIERYDCASCVHLETPYNREPCNDCYSYNSKYKPKKGGK